MTGGRGAGGGKNCSIPRTATEGRRRVLSLGGRGKGVGDGRSELSCVAGYGDHESASNVRRCGSATGRAIRVLHAAGKLCRTTAAICAPAAAAAIWRGTSAGPSRNRYSSLLCGRVRSARGRRGQTPRGRR